jgi:hypothetical protein
LFYSSKGPPYKGAGLNDFFPLRIRYRDLYLSRRAKITHKSIKKLKNFTGVYILENEGEKIRFGNREKYDIMSPIACIFSKFPITL